MLYYTFAPQPQPMMNPIDRYLIQREEAQQAALERQMIAQLNTPTMKFSENSESYQITLSKKPTRFTNKITNNYELKQVGNELVISSTTDDFYKTIQLPYDTNLAADITYKTSNNGFELNINIPKRVLKRVRYVIQPNREFTTPLFLSTPSKRDNVEEAIQRRTETRLAGQHQANTHQNHTAYRNKDNHRPRHHHVICHNTKANCGTRGVQPRRTDPVSGSSIKVQFNEERQINTNGKMKNYETTKRRTVFLPNEIDFEDVIGSNEREDDEVSISSDTDSVVVISDDSNESSIPIRKVRSPTVEDLIDEEFA